MTDIFTMQDARNVLSNKKILFIGDSICRSIYFDLLCLMENGSFTDELDLKKKGNQIPQYHGDYLLRGTGHLISGRDYKEIRRYTLHGTEIEFFFSSRCYRRSLESYLLSSYEDEHYFDIIIVLSAMWDITRWGPEGSHDYSRNCGKLLKSVSEKFKDANLIWLLCPPISHTVSGALMVEDLNTITEQFRFLIMEGNQAIAEVVRGYGYDILDLHYYCLPQIHMRMDDGMHWTSAGVRYQSNLLLTHISISLNLKLPSRWSGMLNKPLSKIVITASNGDDRSLNNEPPVKIRKIKLTSTIPEDSGFAESDEFIHSSTEEHDNILRGWEVIDVWEEDDAKKEDTRDDFTKTSTTVEPVDVTENNVYRKVCLKSVHRADELKVDKPQGADKLNEAKKEVVAGVIQLQDAESVQVEVHNEKFKSSLSGTSDQPVTENDCTAEREHDDEKFDTWRTSADASPPNGELISDHVTLSSDPEVLPDLNCYKRKRRSRSITSSNGTTPRRKVRIRSEDDSCDSGNRQKHNAQSKLSRRYGIHALSPDSDHSDESHCANGREARRAKCSPPKSYKRYNQPSKRKIKRLNEREKSRRGDRQKKKRRKDKSPKRGGKSEYTSSPYSSPSPLSEYAKHISDDAKKSYVLSEGEITPGSDYEMSRLRQPAHSPMGANGANSSLMEMPRRRYENNIWVNQTDDQYNRFNCHSMNDRRNFEENYFPENAYYFEAEMAMRIRHSTPGQAFTFSPPRFNRDSFTTPSRDDKMSSTGSRQFDSPFDLRKYLHSRQQYSSVSRDEPPFWSDEGSFIRRAITVRNPIFENHERSWQLEARISLSPHRSNENQPLPEFSADHLTPYERIAMLESSYSVDGNASSRDTFLR